MLIAVLLQINPTSFQVSRKLSDLTSHRARLCGRAQILGSHTALAQDGVHRFEPPSSNLDHFSFLCTGIISFVAQLLSVYFFDADEFEGLWYDLPKYYENRLIDLQFSVRRLLCRVNKKRTSPTKGIPGRSVDRVDAPQITLLFSLIFFCFIRDHFCCVAARFTCLWIA